MTEAIDRALKTYTTTELAAYLGLSERTLRSWRADGYGPRWQKIGGRYRYEADAVEEWKRAVTGGGGHKR